LLTFIPELFVFSSAVQKSKNHNTEDYSSGCDTRSLILKEEHRLKVFENRVEEDIGPRRNEVAGGWRKLHNEELHDLYSLPNIIRMMKAWIWAGHVARMGEERNVYIILVGKLEGTRPLGRQRSRWVDNIKMALRQR
jgi:hypothetical protein